MLNKRSKSSMTDGVAADSSSSTRSIPRELIREILRFFWNDERALKQCALVSQEWLLESRPFLFRNIDLLQRDSLEVFTSNVLHSERLRPWLTSIHHLSFHLRIDEESFILEISAHLLNLRTVKWDLDVRPDGPCAPSAELLNALGRFSRLQHLELSQHGSFSSFEGVKKIIAAFPALSSLSLFGALWTPVCPNEQSSGLAPGYNRPTLVKLSVSTGYGCPKQPIDDVLLWLSTTPTQYLLRELAFDVGNLNSALRLIAGRSLSVVDVAFDIAWPEPFDDGAQAAQLQRLASQVGEIELIRLHLMDRGWDVHFVTWSGVARVLRIFAALASVRRLRLCCRSFGSDSSPDGASPDMLACAAHLDPVLASSENNAFRSLRAVEFAMYVYDRSGSEKALEKHYALYSAWVQGMLPHLHERGIAQIYVYNDVEVFGPAGLNGHGCEPDFPHAYPPAPC